MTYISKMLLYCKIFFCSEIYIILLDSSCIGGSHISRNISRVWQTQASNLSLVALLFIQGMHCMV